eukprot:2164810-Pyramimonas_sp.AAC.1
MITEHHVLVTATNAEQGHLHAMGCDRHGDADEPLLVPWVAIYDDTYDQDSDEHGQYAELCFTAVMAKNVLTVQQRNSIRNGQQTIVR